MNSYFQFSQCSCNWWSRSHDSSDVRQCTPTLSYKNPILLNLWCHNQSVNPFLSIWAPHVGWNSLSKCLENSMMWSSKNWHFIFSFRYIPVLLVIYWQSRAPTREFALTNWILKMSRPIKSTKSTPAGYVINVLSSVGSGGWTMQYAIPSTRIV